LNFSKFNPTALHPVENLLGPLSEAMLATQLLGVWIAEVLVMVGEVLKLHFHLMPQTPYSSKAFLLTVHVEKFHVSLNLYMLPLSVFFHFFEISTCILL
jgi:hypothetical protein